MELSDGTVLRFASDGKPLRCIICLNPLDKHGCELTRTESSMFCICKNAVLKVDDWKILDGRT